MKLNNKGMVMKNFLIWGSIILVFLLIAIFYIQRVIGSMDKNLDSAVDESRNEDKIEQPEENKETTYADLEIELENAAIDYVSFHYEETGIPSSITIKYDDLKKEELLVTINDLKDKSECTGYVVIRSNENDEIDSKPYLSCSNYKTSGYENWR